MNINIFELKYKIVSNLTYINIGIVDRKVLIFFEKKLTKKTRKVPKLQNWGAFCASIGCTRALKVRCRKANSRRKISGCCGHLVVLLCYHHFIQRNLFGLYGL